MQIATLISIMLYFILMLGIGVFAMRRSTGSAAGYLLGGRQLGPAVTALSAGASDMSAWILMGLPGAMVATGFSSAWIVVGLLIGAYWNYRLVAPRLRVFTEHANDALTLPDYFETRFRDQSHILRCVASLVIVLFFTIYTSSGLVAGGVLFESSFGLSYTLGILVTACVVVAYTFLGGFHAVCLTDFAQGSIMFVALVLVPFMAFTDLGSVAEVSDTISAVSPGHLSWFRGVGILAIISNMAWGLGYFGQPHIIVRFMAIRSVRETGTARRIGMSWMFVSVTGALMTGLVGYAWVLRNNVPLDDPETIFIVLTQLLFHPFIGGFLLAAILAAIMSTISSQLLVSSSSLSQDIYKVFVNPAADDRQLILVSRLAVIAVAVVAAVLALDRSSSILGLVSNAWAGFGAAFGPMVLMSLYWQDMNRHGALAGMLAGAVVVLLWIYLPVSINGQSLSSLMYEIVPGSLCSALAIWWVSRVTGKASEQVQQEFSAAEARLN
jgi:SSS family solute:Na+ symporter